MNQKKDINSNHETIDDQKMIENLLDGNAKQSDSQTTDAQDSKQRQVIYTKQVGCFDIKSIIINLIVYTLVLMVTSGWFDGFYVENTFAALNTALVMSALNIILKPIIVLLTLPLTIITFGLFYVIINGLI
ncbi:MAG: phage holin family protein, partial [Turicibacter sp.]|nr:phage holin family protein [Turicibacter sp.]